MPLLSSSRRSIGLLLHLILEFANLLLNLFLLFGIFGFNYLLLLIILLFLFNYLQLDNKKLDALKKSKERSAIMQVSDFSVGNRICHDRWFLFVIHFMNFILASLDNIEILMSI